jgi:hypothetical protein
MNIKKLLIICVIVLFLGVAIAPSINANVNKTLVDLKQKKQIPIFEEPDSKEYLFETIIEIANNPDIKKLSSRYNQNLFIYDFDNKGILKQLFFKNFQQLFSILFKKPSLTSDYLESIYNKGTELADLFTEDDIAEMMESLSIVNREILVKSDNIIGNDEMLSKKISTLNEINEDINPNQLPWNFTIICTILAIIIVPVYTLGVVAYMGGWVFPSLARTAFQILFISLVPIMIILFPLFIIASSLGCWWTY